MSQNRATRKGVTPVIAIVILLLITVALAGTAWSYLAGFTATQTQKTFEIPSGGAGAFCRAIPGDCDEAVGVQACDQFVVLVTNTGQGAVIKMDDFIVREIDGKGNIPLKIGTGSADNTYDTTKFLPDGINTGESAAALVLTCTTASPLNCSAYLAGPPAGTHTIRIGTSGVTKTVTVTCPG